MRLPNMSTSALGKFSVLQSRSPHWYRTYSAKASTSMMHAMQTSVYLLQFGLSAVKHYFFFGCILILRFPYVENLLHFNFADFPVNFIKQFVSRFFWCFKQMSLSKFVRYYLHYIIKEYCISYHGRVDILCRQNHGDGQFQKFARI